MSKFYAILLLTCSLLLSWQLPAQSLSKSFSHKDFESAEKSSDYIKFEGKSTKFGLVTTSFGGIVKDFSVSAEKRGQAIGNIIVKFPIEKMDTDSESRDEKMHGLCFDSKKYKELKIEFKRPIFAGDKEKTVDAEMTIRGKKKKIKIKISAVIEAGKLVAKGGTTLDFEYLEIPDPSIAIASVDKNFNINFNVAIELPKEAPKKK
ncbi:MAG: YceI family protein [Bacteriovoracaceae bacterium]|nr:YceI family protein [Bacteriovoracaceae bacterium]